MGKQAVTPEQAKKIEAAKAAGRVPRDVRREIQEAVLQSQQIDMSKYYYSRIRFLADEISIDEITGAVTLIWNATERYAFSYHVRQQVDGEAINVLATYADTNLLEERSTNQGEEVRIVGVSIRHTPASEALIAQLWDHFMSVTMRLGDAEILHLGNPSDVPGSAQASQGPTFLVAPPTTDRVPPRVFPASKGWETMDNILVLRDPIIWTPSGKDAKMDVKFQLHHQQQFISDAPRVAPDVPWKPPTELGMPGTYVDYFVKLYCVTSGPRGVNQ